MMRRPDISTIFVFLAGLLVSCGNDTVAGKTTTTSNGGGVVAVGPNGKPLSGCVAFAARSWDPLAGKPGIVDTLQGDSAGNIPLLQEAYAFLEIQDSARSLGSWTKRVGVPVGSRRIIALDSLRPLQGQWADRASIVHGRLFLDSSFCSTPVQNSDGVFTFGNVPTSDYAMVLEADSMALRPMGSVRLGADNVRYTGSGNIVVTGDTTGSPLWIDDFESGTIWPMLHQSVPGVTPWYTWSSLATMTLPTSNQSDSFLRAIGPDSTRAGRSFHSRFVTHDPYAWVALGLMGMEIDLSARSQLCFSYRTDTLLKIQFQRDSVGGVRPALSSTVPSSLEWRDVCVVTSGFAPNSDTPDSLKTWSNFGKRVLVIEFQTPAGGTFLDLDDIRMR